MNETETNMGKTKVQDVVLCKYCGPKYKMLQVYRILMLVIYCGSWCIKSAAAASQAGSGLCWAVLMKQGRSVQQHAWHVGPRGGWAQSSTFGLDVAQSTESSCSKCNPRSFFSLSLFFFCETSGIYLQLVSKAQVGLLQRETDVQPLGTEEKQGRDRRWL